MFTKRPDKSVSPEPIRPASSQSTQTWETSSPAGVGKMSPSVIGSDLTIMGNLESKGEVTVEGNIQGDIHCAMLMVGDSAQITGGIVAEEVIVRGKVMGSIRGNKVTLQSTSHVEGDVFHKSLAIEQGAFFEGKSRRSDDPIGSAPRPGQAASNGHAELPSMSN